MCGDDTLSENASSSTRLSSNPPSKKEEIPASLTHEVVESHLADEEELRLLAKKMENDTNAAQYEKQVEVENNTRCYYCNEPSDHYVEYIGIYICGTSVDCLEKYLNHSQLPLEEVNTDTIQEITRWEEYESDGYEYDDDISTEKDDEPLDQTFLEKTCVLYQENGKEFRITSYMKDRVAYLNINNANVKLDDFKNIINDISPINNQEADTESVSASDLSALEQERLHEMDTAFIIGALIFIISSMSIIASLYIIATR